MTRGPGRAAAAALLAAAGCAGSGIGATELPDAPIAVQWRDVTAARKRAEYEEAQTQGADAARGRTPGVADVGDIGDFLRHVAGVAPRVPSEAGTAGRLALIDPHSGDVTPLAAALPDALPVAWVVPGRRLLFSQFEGDMRQLYELDLERGEVRQRTRGPLAHARGCVLPDGSLVASAAGPEAPAPGAPPRLVSRIVVYRSGRPEPEPLSSGPEDHSPACAPDGRAVVWVSRGPRGREDLVSRMPVEADPRPIGPGRDPSFSRDGAWIAYASPVGRSFRIQRVRPDGSARASIGASDLEEREPAFDPSGRLLVYVVYEGYQRRLHVRRLDGSGDRILFADGGAEHPVW
jgi:hypothetical protein